MKLKHILLLIVVATLLGCSEESNFKAEINQFSSSPVLADKLASPKPQNQTPSYLSYEHSLDFELENNQVESVYNQLIKACAEASEMPCQMLSSRLNKGEFQNAFLQLRLEPSRVDAMIKIPGTFGRLVSRTTDVEDLQEAIFDQGKRLEMLQQYQKRLLKLEQRSTDTLDSLIKVAKELSQVQTDIEYAQGKKAKLLKRTKMDVLNIQLSSQMDSSFWGSVADSFSYFLDNFSDGISQVITGIAYIVPWSLLLIIFLMAAKQVKRRFL